MHTADRTLPALPLAATAAAMVRGVLVAAKNLWRSYRNRQKVGALMEFDDRMLADIGLLRGDVSAALSSPPGIDPSARLRILATERLAREGAAASGGDSGSAW